MGNRYRQLAGTLDRDNLAFGVSLFAEIRKDCAVHAWNCGSDQKQMVVGILNGLAARLKRGARDYDMPELLQSPHSPVQTG